MAMLYEDWQQLQTRYEEWEEIAPYDENIQYKDKSLR